MCRVLDEAVNFWAHINLLYRVMLYCMSWLEGQKFSIHMLHSVLH